MDHPLPSPDALVRPWRTATFLASGLAALELVALVVAGAAFLAKPLARHMRLQAEAKVFAPAKQQIAAQTLAIGATKLGRGETAVLVLNGNGRGGAASAAAARVRGLGYIISGTGNAPRADYASTAVLYRPGFRAEGQRLAKDLHLKVWGPLDGMKPSQLQGAHLALVLGAR